MLDRPPIQGRRPSRATLPHLRLRPRPSAPDEAVLWQRFRDEGDLDARDRLVEHHFALVHKVARRFEPGDAASGRYAELVCAGAEGLLQAVERFEPSRGYRLSTFAVARIDGAIRDYLRRDAAVPRSVTDTARRVAAARIRVENRLGRGATSVEVAEELGVLMAEYQEMAAWSAMSVVAYPDDLAAPGPEETPREVALWLRDAVAALPPAERSVITLAYFEDRPAREIAAALGVSESRISQIRTRALARLRAGGEAA